LIGQEAQRVGNRERIVEAAVIDVRLPDDDERSAPFGVKQAFHRGQRRWLMPDDVMDLSVAGGERHQDGGDRARHHAQPHEGAAGFLVPAREQIERAHRGHDEAGGDHRSDHVVQVLPKQPRIQQQAPQTAQQNLAVCADAVAGGMLHPGVGGDDEEPGEPRAGEDQKRGDPVGLRPEALLSEQERAEEAGFQEKRKHAFHGQSLSDHPSGRFGEAGPVGPELKLHGDAGDHAHGEIDRKYFCPEPGRAVVMLVSSAHGHGLEHQDQQRQPHGQLRKEVMKGDGECKMQTVNG
jgi:hypothetical protein